MSELVERYHAVLSQIAEACRKSSRKRESVRLLAVSKYHPFESMLELARAGQLLFGENYVQEAQEKSAALREEGYDPARMIHIIGHLQRRKVPHVVGNFALLHTLDSLPLASALEKRAASLGIVQDVLIEVNLGREAQKAGIAEEELCAFSEKVLDLCPHVQLCGLMCIPPADAEGENVRPYFARLRMLRDALSQRIGQILPELSMGMSGDYLLAIEEGATIVRVGTALFGERVTPKR